jgi:membrane associated rhomboid family serine protease
MLVIPLGKEDQSGIPVLTLLVCVACVLVFLAAQTEAAKLSLAYYPRSPNLLKMVSSIFVHADIFHLVGNLFFFYCFSRTVESDVTNRGYVLVFLIFILTTNLAYCISARDPIPTIGLSGVVWGFMGIFVMRYPKANINCLVWYLWVVKKIEVPAFVFILAFLAFDIGAFREAPHSGINHIAHISGFISGVGFKFFSGGLWRAGGAPDARISLRRQ